MTDLNVIPERHEQKEHWQTGIFVRAKVGDKWDSIDIATLDKPSLLSFLKSRGGDNRWAEDVCGIILGHGHLHEPSKQGLGR